MIWDYGSILQNSINCSITENVFSVISFIVQCEGEDVRVLQTYKMMIIVIENFYVSFIGLVQYKIVISLFLPQLFSNVVFSIVIKICFWKQIFLLCGQFCNLYLKSCLKYPFFLIEYRTSFEAKISTCFSLNDLYVFDINSVSGIYSLGNSIGLLLCFRLLNGIITPLFMF